MGIITLIARWGGPCSECGGHIARGESVVYTPPKRSQQHGTVRHVDGKCGSVYAVHAIFSSTRKVITVNATSARIALERATNIMDRRGWARQVLSNPDTSERQASIANSILRRPASEFPAAYEVWQGNVRVG